MVTPRHHGWLHEADYYEDRGCNDVEDWVNPQCCQQLWDLGFDDADSCRQPVESITMRYRMSTVTETPGVCEFGNGQ